MPAGHGLEASGLPFAPFRGAVDDGGVASAVRPA